MRPTPSSRAHESLWHQIVRLPTERVTTTIVVLGLVMLVAHLAVLLLYPKPDGRVVVGDAVHYYVQLRSVVFDHDLDFRNDYITLYGIEDAEGQAEWVSTHLAPSGRVRNYMPVGPAILAAPLYLVVAGVMQLLSLAGLAAPPTGFERPLQAVLGVTGVLAATLAAWLAWRLARTHCERASSAWAVLAVWLGSSALYYSLVAPSYSHAASMLASSVFCVLWLGAEPRATLGRSLLLGAAAGLATLMRWQDVLLLGVAAMELWSRHSRWRNRLLHVGAAGLAWLVVFSPQMIVWQRLYGQPLAIPQGPSFMRWGDPHLWDVLFSPLHGLISWTPIVAFATAGLVVFCWKRRDLAFSVTVWLLVSWYVNAAVADWWAGEAFGARRFLSLFPILVLGLASWLSPDGSGPKRLRTGIAGALVAANLLLLFQYQLFLKGMRDLAPYPSDWYNLYAARFIVPLRVLARWLGA
jgi:hypothetical protein